MTGGMRFQVLNLIAMRRALDQHNDRCPEPARAFLLNPTDHGLLGWEDLWGIPVLADSRVPVKRFRIDCPGSAANIEGELAEYLGDRETEDVIGPDRF
jgi:hypothetical protein